MIVVDASVLADALVDDGDVGQHARAALSEDKHWVALAHLLLDVLSVVRDKVLGGELCTKRGDEDVAAMTALAIERPPWRVDSIEPAEDSVDRLHDLGEIEFVTRHTRA